MKTNDMNIVSETLDVSFKDKALAIWEAENQVSIQFETISSEQNNPFVPNMKKLYSFLNEDIDAYQGLFGADIEKINHCIGLLKGGKNGYISLDQKDTDVSSPKIEVV